MQLASILTVVNAADVKDLDLDPELGILEEEAEAWVGAVDKKISKKMKEKEVKRQEHIYEFIITEKHHCLTLKVMQKVRDDWKSMACPLWPYFTCFPLSVCVDPFGAKFSRYLLKECAANYVSRRTSSIAFSRAWKNCSTTTYISCDDYASASDRNRLSAPSRTSCGSSFRVFSAISCGMFAPLPLLRVTRRLIDPTRVDFRRFRFLLLSLFVYFAPLEMSAFILAFLCLRPS